MYPELEAAFAALDPAQAAYDKARAEAPQECDYEVDADECPRCAYRAPYREAFDMARDAAWEALRASDKPLLRWIADNCRGYEEEALAVVRLLPAPMSALDALAREKGWCAAWDAARDAAEKAGVLDAETEEVSA